MRIVIEHFGPIEHVEFDLTKDINVVFGKNNIGKSYAITAVYLVIKQLLEQLEDFNSAWGHIYENSSFYDRHTRKPSQLFTPFIQKVRAELKQTDIDLTELFEELAKTLFTSVIGEQLSASFNNSFESVAQIAQNRTGKELAIRVEFRLLTICLHAQGNKLVLERVQYNQPVVGRRVRTHREAIINDRQVVLYFKSAANESNIAAPSERDREAAQSGLTNSLLHIRRELRSVAKSIYFLPASRSGLYQALSAFGAVIAELSKNRRFITESSISLPSISEPVADYFLHLANVNPRATGGALYRLGQQMEADLLGGVVGFDPQTKKMTFSQPQIGQPLDLAFTSSMISEIAPIVAYLKYVLPEQASSSEAPTLFDLPADEAGVADDVSAEMTEAPEFPAVLLFIEELEAHLHPEVQVKLMEFFAKLTKYNVRVLMTTHSNYIFNKLSNMVLKGELTEAQVGSHLMRATPTGSVVVPGEMQAVDGQGIPDENFVDVAEQLYNERLEAYDQQDNAA